MSGTSDEETKFAPTSQNFTSFTALFVDIIIIEFVTLLLFLADDVAKRNTEEEEDHVAPLVKNVVLVVVVVVAVYSFSFSVSLSSR